MMFCKAYDPRFCLGYQTSMIGWKETWLDTGPERREKREKREKRGKRERM